MVTRYIRAWTKICNPVCKRLILTQVSSHKHLMELMPNLLRLLLTLKRELSMLLSEMLIQKVQIALLIITMPQCLNVLLVQLSNLLLFTLQQLKRGGQLIKRLMIHQQIIMAGNQPILIINGVDKSQCILL